MALHFYHKISLVLIFLQKHHLQFVYHLLGIFYEKSLKKKEKEKSEEKKMFKIKPPNFVFEFKKINNTD